MENLSFSSQQQEALARHIAQQQSEALGLGIASMLRVFTQALSEEEVDQAVIRKAAGYAISKLAETNPEASAAMLASFQKG